jgi:hypothetical protein
VRKLAEDTLVAIGRMVVAATELEHVLAWIGADRAGGDAAATFDEIATRLLRCRDALQVLIQAQLNTSR